MDTRTYTITTTDTQAQLEFEYLCEPAPSIIETQLAGLAQVTRAVTVEQLPLRGQITCSLDNLDAVKAALEPAVFV